MASIDDATASPHSAALLMKNYTAEFYQISTGQYTRKKSKELIRKIEGLTSTYQAKELQGQVFVAQRIKTMNESIYYNIDMLHSAINSNKKIRFQYYNWSVDKKQELRHGGEYYIVSPWGVCWNDEWYYLIAFDDKTQEIRHYRVNNPASVSLLSGVWKPQIRFLGNRHSGDGNH